MEVILLEKIHNLGELGQQLKVKPGYGRNYLIPNGKAIPATPENIAKFESRREELEKANQEAFVQASSRAEKINGLSITLSRKASLEGKLYGSVGTADIVEAVKAQGVELGKHEVRLPQGPFRMVGEYQVDIHLHADIDTTLGLVISIEED